MQADSLLDALKINPEKYRVIAVVGGGGKTSLIFRLMEELIGFYWKNSDSDNDHAHGI